MQNAWVLNQEILINPELFHPWNMPNEKSIRIFSTFSQICKQEMKFNISDITLWKRH